MKGAIITNSFYSTENTKYQSSRLASELSLLGVDVEIVKNANLAHIDGKNIQSYFSDCDFCIYFDKDKYLSAMLEKLGICIFNSRSSIELCDDKMETYIKLCGHNIAMPRTVSGLMCYNSDCRPNKDYFDQLEGIVGSYPIIIKECYGSLGSGIFMAKTRQELETLILGRVGKAYLAQEAIVSSLGRDVRVIVVGGEVKASMLRKSDIDFRSNLSLGGNASAISLPDNWKELCEKVANILGLDYCGIDLLFGKNGEPILCEVNSNAFFGGIEKVSGQNIARDYAQYIVDTMQQKSKKQ